MPTLDDFKAKYSAVLEYIQSHNVRLDHLHVEGDKLVIQGAAPTEIIRNDVWNTIKTIDPIFGDLKCEIGIDPSIPAPVRTYTVVAGDSLWKIADMFYGNGSKYPEIIAANPDKLKDEKSVIHPGDVLVVPE
ncbi:MAG: LysM peptidoglycan-binding domain-containing protein [Acidobacteria bacterium]|nr:LysM peptidoglycan-binding domain-containing protein [Acidobacteriota bacterium]